MSRASSSTRRNKRVSAHPTARGTGRATCPSRAAPGAVLRRTTNPDPALPERQTSTQLSIPRRRQDHPCRSMPRLRDNPGPIHPLSRRQSKTHRAASRRPPYPARSHPRSIRFDKPAHTRTYQDDPHRQTVSFPDLAFPRDCSSPLPSASARHSPPALSHTRTTTQRQSSPSPCFCRQTMPLPTLSTRRATPALRLLASIWSHRRPEPTYSEIARSPNDVFRQHPTVRSGSRRQHRAMRPKPCRRARPAPATLADNPIQALPLQFVRQSGAALSAARSCDNTTRVSLFRVRATNSPEPCHADQPDPDRCDNPVLPHPHPKTTVQSSTGRTQATRQPVPFRDWPSRQANPTRPEPTRSDKPGQSQGCSIPPDKSRRDNPTLFPPTRDDTTSHLTTEHPSAIRQIQPCTPPMRPEPNRLPSPRRPEPIRSNASR